MDNVRFHKTSQVILRFIPSYNPQLNPIEEYISILKSRHSTANPRAQTMKVAQINLKKQF